MIKVFPNIVELRVFCHIQNGILKKESSQESSIALEIFLIKPMNHLVQSPCYSSKMLTSILSDEANDLLLL